MKDYINKIPNIPIFSLYTHFPVTKYILSFVPVYLNYIQTCLTIRVTFYKQDLYLFAHFRISSSVVGKIANKLDRQVSKC